jgi:hypothetical protein
MKKNFRQKGMIKILVELAFACAAENDQVAL